MIVWSSFFDPEHICTSIESLSLNTHSLGTFKMVLIFPMNRNVVLSFSVGILFV